jgi:hypothetical protein
VGQSQSLGAGWSVNSGTRTHSGLLSQTPEHYGEKFQDHLLEQYKLYVESAQQISERRLHAANFFLAINSSLVAVFGIVYSSFGHHRWNAAIPATGILVSIVWFRLVKSYKDLNSTKFFVIHELEAYLPAALFKYEWQVCGHGDPKIYKPLTHTEQWIPVVFMILYLALTLYALLARPDTIGRSFGHAFGLG